MIAPENDDVQVLAEALNVTPGPQPARQLLEAERQTRDPARAMVGMPPNLGQPAVPHVLTFQGLLSSIAKVYRASDEALKQSLENARFMRNDPMIMECVEQRQRSLALLDWHLEPGDEKDPAQQALVEELTAIIQATPRFMQYRENLAHAVWFGRYGVSHRYAWKKIKGKLRVAIDHWTPVHGDKLVFRYDDGSGEHDPNQVGIRVNTTMAAGQHLQGRWLIESLRRGDATETSPNVQATDRGLAYFLSPEQRPLLAVHRHYIEDGEFEDPINAGRIHGVGLRSRLYWVWVQKQELLAWLMEYLERSAFGIEIWYYPWGNDDAKRMTQEAAEKRIGDGRNIILAPKPSGEESMQYGVQRIEPGMAGADTVLKILSEFFGHLMKRYILGQTLTSEAGSTGLGSNLASVHLDTYMQIIRYDATNLEETLTTDLVEPLLAYNFPRMSGCGIKFKIDTETPDAEAKLNAWKTAWEMGAKIRAADVYELIAAQPPEKGDEVLQQPQQGPGGPGGPGMPPSGPGGGPGPQQPQGPQSPPDDAQQLYGAIQRQGDVNDLEKALDVQQSQNTERSKVDDRGGDINGPLPDDRQQLEQALPHASGFDAEALGRGLAAEMANIPDVGLALKVAEKKLERDPKAYDVEKYAQQGERWITLNGGDGDGTPVKIDNDGDIVAGPRGLAEKGIRKLDDFGSKSPGKAQNQKNGGASASVTGGDESAPATDPRHEWKEKGTRSKAFKSWFGDWEGDPAGASKVVDASGDPQETHGTAKEVYHGTTSDFDAFSKDKIGAVAIHAGRGFYFAENRKIADNFAKRFKSSPQGLKRIDGRVISAYLNIRKPLDLDASVDPSEIGRWADAAHEVSGGMFEKDDFVEECTKVANYLQSKGKPFTAYQLWKSAATYLHKGKEQVNDVVRSLGHDGLAHTASDDRGDVRAPSSSGPSFGKVWIAFEPNQIKSVQNQGTFDPSDERLDYSPLARAEKYSLSAMREAIERAAAETDQSPSDDQKKSGNYRKGKVRLHGLEIAIENPRGSTRSGQSKDGKPWSVTMADHYGYIKRTLSDADGDHVDVFIGPHPDSELVVVIDQNTPGGRFDEHKVMLGFKSQQSAIDAYHANYSPGWKGFRHARAMTMDDFKAWLDEGDTGEPIEKAKYSHSGERWITLNGGDGDGTPVKIDNDGDIVAGPRGLAEKGIRKLDDFGKFSSKRGGTLVGRGSSGEVYRVGDEVRKNATRREGEVYEKLRGVAGVAAGRRDGDEIVTPYFKNIVSVDAVPEQRRKSMAPVVRGSYRNLVNALTFLSRAGYDYNDPLQVGFDAERKASLFDFSAAEKSDVDSATDANLVRLSHFLSQFGLDGYAKSVTHVNSVRRMMNDLDNPFMSGEPETEDARKLASQVPGGSAKNWYFCTNGRHIKGVAQTEPRNGIKVIASDLPLSEKFMQEWEIVPVVHGEQEDATPVKIDEKAKYSKWSEADHPRDDDGRFSEQPAGVGKQKVKIGGMAVEAEWNRDGSQRVALHGEKKIVTFTRDGVRHGSVTDGDGKTHDFIVRRPAGGYSDEKPEVESVSATKAEQPVADDKSQNDRDMEDFERQASRELEARRKTERDRIAANTGFEPLEPQHAIDALRKGGLDVYKKPQPRAGRPERPGFEVSKVQGRKTWLMAQARAVEDHDSVTDQMHKALEAAGFTVTRADDPDGPTAGRGSRHMLFIRRPARKDQ